MNNFEIQTILIKLNGVRESLQYDLEDLKAKRGQVSESMISVLETKIGRRETEIKDLNSMELDLREHLT